MPANRAGGEVRAADGDRPCRLHPLDNRGVSTRIGLRQRLESLGGRRADDVDVVLDGEGHPVERGQRYATSGGTVGRLSRIQRLLGQDDYDRVDRGVDGLDPSEVGFHDLGAGRLPCPDRLGQLCGAHPPKFGGCYHGHVGISLYGPRRCPAAAAAVAAPSAPSTLMAHRRGSLVAGCL